ncbi:single-stranded DNA-binding protein [Microbacterium sp. CBA3102]|uniref:single-stranded DNA-binding protein n=1 Tax=Microbacterium sp. CBA3102 TaxID=2603598 RepID=UPI0011BB4858|nr:single-stranded DNA-binding protein [Microbacterium sp. CBA3102]QEA30084.1 single-stranded DNA-binding protein [Microbacterium sp. CBA3102]
MAIHTQESFTGFIASDPQLSHTGKGEARFYARVGQEHYRKEPDGSFTELETTFHDLVAYRATAERAHERFAKGDSFVAEGYAHPYGYERDGQTVQGEEFVAKKIGHDLARTSYEVDRNPRAANTAEQEAPTPTAGREAAGNEELRRSSPSAAPGLGL